MAKARCNIYLEEDVKEWAQTQAEMMGMSLSAFIAMCVYNYRQSQEGLKAMRDLSLYGEQFHVMREVLEELKVAKAKD
jgi:hypothetical protein